MKTKIAIIGGTGIDQDLNFLEDISTIEVPKTPYGYPSDPTLLSGKYNGIDVVLMSRHGKNHSINPSDVNYRANIWALKSLNCTHIIATTACGSLKESIEPETFCILDQYIDRTQGIRPPSFFRVCHIGQAHPFDQQMQKILEESCEELGFKYHPKGLAITIEGPRFSTFGESQLYRLWGADIVNMTSVPEAQLAAEAGLIYSALGLVTDFDCWHEDENESVSVELVTKRLKILKRNSRMVISLAIKKMAKHDWSDLLDIKRKQVEEAIMFR